MQTFVSRDVLFHEFVFPFQPSSTGSYMQPTPQITAATPDPSAYDDFFSRENAEDNILDDQSHRQSPLSSPDAAESTAVPLRRSTRLHTTPT